MLRYLDVIIAFSVIMLGLSLVITILNQMISAFLSYRGSNLRWGIQTMLSTLNEGVLGPESKSKTKTNPKRTHSLGIREIWERGFASPGKPPKSVETRVGHRRGHVGANVDKGLRRNAGGKSDCRSGYRCAAGCP